MEDEVMHAGQNEVGATATSSETAMIFWRI